MNSSSATIGVLHPNLLAFFLVFNLLICGEIIGWLGIVANVINIMIFSKQGYRDSVNVTLTALAVSDIGSLVTAQLFNLMVNPWFLYADLPFSPAEIARTFSFYPHGYFTRVSGFVTAFAAFERCISVVFPLKVKSVITPRVASVVNITIFTVLLLDLFPYAYTAYFDWRFYPSLNRSVLHLAIRPYALDVYRVSYLVTDMAVPNATFLILIASNAIIVVKLRANSTWRKTVTTSGQTVGSLSTKERKMVVMLSVVSAIFIVCLIPQSAILTAITFVTELKVNGVYFDVSLLCYSVSFLSETINASVNILVYYRMSTKYRETIIVLMRRSKTALLPFSTYIKS